jgi:DNA repair ATPase RecN
MSIERRVYHGILWSMEDFDRQFRRVWDTLQETAAIGREAERRANARMDRADARMDRAEARMDRLERQMRGMQALVKTGMRWMAKIAQDHRNLDKKIDALVDAQMRTEEALRRWLETRNGSNGHKKS